MFFPTRASRARSRRNDALLLLGGAALGATLMYFLHPRTRPRLATRAEAVDDAVLGERVRAAISRVVDDPRGIDVRVRDGCVILKGPVVPEEAGELVACAGRVPGVRTVENRLSINAPATEIRQ
jgi:BON domain-containing protein